MADRDIPQQLRKGPAALSFCSICLEILMKKYRVQTRIINSSRVTQQTLIKKVYGVCVTDFGPWSTDLNSLSKHHFERPPAVA
ncbi:hypothetical protein Hamer_G011322 [Homarus americanus]|uniref:Uncharacterized protein n=1 Tax=Homarus americanus TaxID=6706 RepID=A0A8J5MP77_HOMAM|nr:hypothetical protein Hamer_G011322 [Homarus americanus]